MLFLQELLEWHYVPMHIEALFENTLSKMHVVILLISSVINFSQYIKKPHIYIYEALSHENVYKLPNWLLFSKYGLECF